MRKLALTLALAAAAVALTATTAQANTHMFTSDTPTQAPCPPIVEAPDGDLSGGCLIPMTIHEPVSIWAPNSACNLDFDVRFGPGTTVGTGGWSNGLFLDNITVAPVGNDGASQFFCQGVTPIGTWQAPRSGSTAGDAWQAALLSGGTGNPKIAAWARLSNGRSENFYLDVIDDNPLTLKNEIRAEKIDLSDPRKIFKGEWHSTTGVGMYKATPLF